ncbi:hypothetical protein B0J17DRAFT_768129 [Rhizoctonia solani]|nr:hypothetical protein B0J17DRAFT_768129 [Rhizoctonia solani]
MIYSHLSVIHLAAIQKTCRRLFAVTTPYVWRSVDIEPLLQLFPGCVSEIGGEPKLQITTPCPIPDDYFDRFFFYSRFVNCVKITPQFTISGSFQEPSEVTVLASTTGRLTLPHVRAVKLTMIVENSQRRYHDEYADYKYWIDALIPHTIQRISFESFSNYNESLLEALISKSPDLIHLEFASETRSSRFYQQIVGSEAMRNVQLLQYSGSIMDPDILQWFSQMPQLSTLELTLDQEDSEDPNIPEVAYESYAFQAMTTLKVYTCDHSEVENQWDLLRQMWRTPMVKRLTCVEIKVSEPILPGMREFDQFMSVLASQSPNVSNLRLEASGTLANFPEIPVEALSDIRQLPLRTLTIQSPIHSKADQSLFKSLGEINAQLEILDLGSTTVEISDLISAHRYLPSLRYLNIGVWKTKTSKQKLKRSWFSDNNVPFVFPIHPLVALACCYVFENGSWRLTRTHITSITSMCT